MISVWRIVKSEHETTAFNGEGAKLFGGRWNGVGIPMVYTSETLSLATLEYFVNLDMSPPQELSLLAIEAQIPKTLVETAEHLPKGWDILPAPPETQIYGNQWFQNQSSAVLKVPSAIIHKEYNYLINPNHRDFEKIKKYPSAPFSIDSRMWKTTKK